jgi:hypothetical protein
VWNAPISPNVGAYQVRVDLQEGKKRRLDEGFDYRRDDLSEGLHRFQVRAMVNGKWSEWSKEVLLSIPPSPGSKRGASAPGGKGAGAEQAAGSGATGAGAGSDEVKQGEWPGQDMSLLHGVGAVVGAVGGGGGGGGGGGVVTSVPMPGGFDSSSLKAPAESFPMAASVGGGEDGGLYGGECVDVTLTRLRLCFDFTTTLL